MLRRGQSQATGSSAVRFGTLTEPVLGHVYHINMPGVFSKAPQHRTIDRLEAHHILGHAGRDLVKHLAGSVRGITFSTDQQAKEAPLTTECRTCSLSKITSMPSRKERVKADTLYGSITIDLAEFTFGFNGDKYMIHAYDLRTHLHHVGALPRKDTPTILSLFETLHTFVASVGLQIVSLSTGNETSVGSVVFRSALRNKHIIWRPTTPHTPAQDPAERAGGLIIHTARAMRIHANLPKNLWPEIVHVAAYLLNRTPMRRELWKTPFELATGLLPDSSHLRVQVVPARHHIVDAPESLTELCGRVRSAAAEGSSARSVKLYSLCRGTMLCCRRTVSAQADAVTTALRARHKVGSSAQRLEVMDE
nr:retrovirus-related pol polyprotein from transposon tnt 1-94 [Quercus suber]